MERIFAFVALLLMVMSCKSLEQEKVFIPSKKEIKWSHNYYKDAEYFNYSVEYGLLNVGEVTINTADKPVKINNNPFYYVKLDAKMQGAAGWIATLNNHYETFVDTISLCPYKFTRNVQENKYRKKEFTIFDREKNIAIVTDTTKSITNPKIDTFSISYNIQDIITAFFLFRNASLEKMNEGDTIPIDVFLENASYNIQVKYLGKEKIKSKIGKRGKVNALVLAPIIPTDGMLAGDTPVKSWVSDDDQRIPLKIQVKLVVGSVELELRDYRQRSK